ncbi:hypothetical protein HOLleu_11955 [Holothuria leucospilota]|uniref:G-protein coupled receptors family 1 profile domain-containing protein n=1 Tax=Holothuria leucospilota TaxID=206669 RepID=A0A9Q1CAW7_HOLLE|nr:hypothetical protein HOLleu_11955 [Holothuria leucospilota]
MAVMMSKSLQNTSNIFVVNLAVADLATCYCMFPYMYSYWTHVYSPQLEIMCAITAAIVHVYRVQRFYSGIHSSRQIYSDLLLFENQ